MIRKIKKEDRRLFLELAWEFYHSPAVLHPIPREFMEKAFDELTGSDIYLDGYILERDGKPAGYAMLSRSWSMEAGGPVVWLEELYIRPQWQGMGLGSEFLDFLTREIPAARFRLEIEPENDRARALYARYGFEVLPYRQMKRGK